MLIAILADIHGNLPALQAVLADLCRFEPDAVFVAGDFQNRGPQPREVTDLIANRGWILLRGNHEDYVIWQSEREETKDVADFYSWLPARWTASQTRESISWVRGLPIAAEFDRADVPLVRIVHGSPRSNAEGFFPSTSDARMIEMIGRDAPAVLCCAHSHVPLLRRVSDTLVFNVGSIGFPFDGDHRASYGLLHLEKGEWVPELRRVPYCFDQVLELLSDAALIERAGPLMHVICRELESARPQLTLFWTMFGTAVRANQTSIFQAVEEYLALSQEQLQRLKRRFA